MRKKVVCIVLAMVLCITGVCGVSAADERKNIVKNPTMDQNVKDWAGTGGAKVEWCGDSAVGKGGSAKVTLVGNYSGITQPNNFVVGETYEISFYIKMEEGTSTVTLIQQFTSGGWWYIVRDLPVTEKWQKHTVKYTVQPKNTSGAEVTGAGRLEFRIGDGQVKGVHYLDQVEIYPNGDVEAAPEPEETVWVDPLPQAKPVLDTRFSDTAGHWAEDTLKILVDNGLVSGMGDGMFGPEQPVSRAEFITMMMNTLKLEPGKYHGAFSDVSGEAWYADTVQTAQEIGLIDKVLTVGGKLNPDRPVTREEAALILSRTAELKGAEAMEQSAEFADSQEISLWAAAGVSKAAGCGLLKGNPDGRFAPKANITRAEAAQMLWRVVEVQSRLAVYVDPQNGDDANAGTADAPLRTVASAQKLVRTVNREMTNNIYVLLKAGEHYLDAALELTAEDSGNNGYHIIYTSYGGGEASLMSGRHIKDFAVCDPELNIYRAYVGQGMDSRQLFVNGVRAVRARSKGGLADCTTDDGTTGHTTTDTFLADFKHVDDLEMVYYESWTEPRCGVSSISVEDGVATLVMDQPGWKSVTNKGGTSVTQPVYYENAYELLDEPGEWYLNTHDGYLYYIPRSFEKMETADVVLPVGEKLLEMVGTVDQTVHNITFENVRFEYTTWMRPSTSAGHSDAQNNHLRDQGGGGDKMPGTAVLVRNGRYITFKDCTFTKLGITALQLFGAVQDCNVVGNEFYDISGSAVSLGEMYTNDQNIVNPQEKKYFITGNQISNNYIHNIGVDFMSSAAISAGFPKNTQISHNEIYDMPYSGMHIGYGWDSLPTSATENFHITDNYIHVVMNNQIFDGGGIYTIGATGGTMENPNLITGNYIENVKNYHGSLYTDEGTTYWKLAQNVVDLTDTPFWYGKGNNKGNPRWLHVWTSSIRNNQYIDNYSTTAEKTFAGTDCVFEEPHLYPDANWPQPALDIIENAGLTPDYLAVFPDELQEVKLDETTHFMRSGDKIKIGLTGKMRKGKLADMSQEKVYYSSTDPSVAQVDPEGVITAVSSGAASVYADVLMDDILKHFEVHIFVDDTVDTVDFTVDQVSILEGYSYPVEAEATSKYGKEMNIEDAVYTVADPTVATVAEDGRVTGVKRGETRLHATYTVGGEQVEKELPVRVISYGTGEVSSEAGYDLSKEVADLDGWRIDSVGKKEKAGTGVRLATPGGGTNGAAIYNKKKFGNELLTFDMQINAESGWPSLTFRANSFTEAFGNASCYMIGFKNEFLELQRFNNGKRTVIFGDGTSGIPLGGPGLPNIPEKVFDYNTRYTVQVAARNEEEGVRIILNINGRNVFDFLDTDQNALREPGYFGVYARAGNIELTAPTGMTADEGKSE